MWGIEKGRTPFVELPSIQSSAAGAPACALVRIRVTDVLDLFAAGLSREQILEELPDLEPEDLEACLRFASRRVDHPGVVA